MFDKTRAGVKRAAFKWLAAPLASWLGVPFTTEQAGDFLKSWNIQVSAAGQTVSRDTALKLSAVVACVRLIGIIGTLPLPVYRRTDMGRVQARQHDLWNILHNRPSPDASPATFWGSMLASMLLHGDGWAEKLMFNNELRGLRFLRPGRLALVRRGYDRDYQFVYTDDNGRQREIPRERIFHVPGLTIDGKYGLSVIQYGSMMIGNALAANTAANSIMEKGLLLTTGFTYPGTFKGEAERNAAREYIDKLSGAMNQGKSVLIEKGMTVGNVGVPPKDAQLLESRTFGVEEVCRWFGVDPVLVGHGGKDSNFGTGVEQKMLGFLTTTLRYWMTKLEQEINYQLVPAGQRDEYYAEFNFEALLRGDSKARADFYGVMVDHGLMTRDEVRQKENLPLMGGNASILTVNAATVPLDKMLEMSQQPGFASAAFADYCKEKGMVQ